MAKLNLYKGNELLNSVEKTEGKSTITIENLVADTDYPKGTYQVSFSNDSGESDKVDVPQFRTKAIGVASVTLDVESLELTVGDTHQLTATVSPENASNKNVSFESDKSGVASVTAEGLVEAVSAGTANVTVTTEDGSHTDIVAVTVKEPIPEAPADVTVEPGENSADITA
ncbi:major tail protein [Staphylococcus phage phiSA039]|nr:HU-like protein [Staphylococcus phage Metroid]WJJ56948.1 major tail protein [Staphylococcus phage vB_SAP01]BBC69588.1 major tail protein [Staphylococcus phage phiSA039]